MSLFDKLKDGLGHSQTSQSQSQSQSSSRFNPRQQEALGKSNHGVPDIVMRVVDKYVDSIEPALIPKLEAEIASFQSKTLDSLGHHLKEAFHSIFLGGFSSLGSESRRREIAPTSFADNNRDHEKDQLPYEYGQLGLPFAALADDLTDVLTEFDPLKNADPQAREAYLRRDAARQANSSGSQSSGNLLSFALDKVTSFAESSQSQMGFGESASQSSRLDAAASRLGRMNIGRTNQKNDLGSWLNSIIKDVHGDDADAEVKMGEITPELKEKIGALLSQTHRPLATAFTTLSLTQLKRWLRGHISSRDLGSEGKAELTEKLDRLTSKFFKRREAGDSRSAPEAGDQFDSHILSSDEDEAGTFWPTEQQQKADSRSAQSIPSPTSSAPTSTSSQLHKPAKSFGFSAIVSRKLTEGLTHVRVETRDDFRRILAKIEAVLFEALPDCLQGPLSVLFGENPFESNSANANSQNARSLSSFSSKLSSILSVDLSSLLAPILQGLQRALRARLMELVGGGHRLLEAKTWNHVEQAVVQKVSKYIKGVEVNVGENLEEKRSRHLRENEQIKLEGLKDWNWEQGASFGPIKEEEKAKVQESLNKIGKPSQSKTGEAASFYDGSSHSTNQAGIQSYAHPQSNASSAQPQAQAPIQTQQPFSFPMPDHQGSVAPGPNYGFSMPQAEHYQRQ